jgi:hypothetical protein
MGHAGWRSHGNALVRPTFQKSLDEHRTRSRRSRDRGALRSWNASTHIFQRWARALGMLMQSRDFRNSRSGILLARNLEQASLSNFAATTRYS